jgi:hypothetical protein
MWSFTSRKKLLCKRLKTEPTERREFIVQGNLGAGINASPLFSTQTFSNKES